MSPACSARAGCLSSNVSPQRTGPDGPASRAAAPRTLRRLGPAAIRFQQRQPRLGLPAGLTTPAPARQAPCDGEGATNITREGQQPSTADHCERSRRLAPRPHRSGKVPALPRPRPVANERCRPDPIRRGKQGRRAPEVLCVGTRAKVRTSDADAPLVVYIEGATCSSPSGS